MHFEDIRHLLNVLRALVKKGNTVMVIEHNMDVVKQADHVIDLGPEGGAGGGYIQFEGTPEALADADTHTAQFIREELERTAAAEEKSEDEDVDLDSLASDEDDEADDDHLDDEPEAEAEEVAA